MKFTQRIKHAYNALTDKKEEDYYSGDYGAGSSSPAHRVTTRYSESSFSDAIFNRIAVDSSMVEMLHVTIDKDNQNQIKINSGLQNCLDTEANVDQSSIAFMQDLVFSMFDEGVVAAVPVDTTINPEVSGSFDITTMRVGKITQWFPRHVTIELYNDQTGKNQSITVSKKNVAIIENPLYAVVNGPNATLKRLIRKIALLDDIDELVASGKLDLLLQLPYTIKTDSQREQANTRIKSIEDQLKGNKHGIAYIDSSEKVTQLNRPINNQLIEQVNQLTEQFYNQTGLTANVLNGTATESEMRTYYSRTIDPIIKSIVAEYKRKFITKTARTQGHTIVSYRDPFALVPIEQIASIGDTFTRNAILAPNEVRKLIGFGPHSSPQADELFNRNISERNQVTPGSPTSPDADALLDLPVNSQNGGES